MTAEIAATVPAVLLVLGVSLSALQLGSDRLRCQDAARVAVRELARGESTDQALADATRMLPRGAATAVTSSASAVTVTVTVPTPSLVHGLGIGGSTSCRSTAVPERAGS